MRPVELQPFFDPDLLRDRAHPLAEALEGVVRLEDVEDEEPLLVCAATWTRRPSNGSSDIERSG